MLTPQLRTFTRASGASVLVGARSAEDSDNDVTFFVTHFVQILRSRLSLAVQECDFTPSPRTRPGSGWSPVDCGARSKITYDMEPPEDRLNFVRDR